MALARCLFWQTVAHYSNTSQLIHSATEKYLDCFQIGWGKLQNYCQNPLPPPNMAIGFHLLQVSTLGCNVQTRRSKLYLVCLPQRPCHLPSLTTMYHARLVCLDVSSHLTTHRVPSTVSLSFFLLFFSQPGANLFPLQAMSFVEQNVL